MEHASIDMFPELCTLQHTLHGHASPVLSLTFTKNGNYILSSSQDRSLILWNPHTGLHVKTYSGPHNHEVNDAIITEDNARFVSCGGDKHVFLWDVTTAQVIRRFAGHERKVNSLAFGPKQEIFLSASNDKSVRLWDMRSHARDPIQVLADAADSVLSLRIAGNEIVTGSADGGLRRYDVRRGQLCVDQLSQPIGSITSSKDNQCLLISTLDNTVRLLERETGNELASYSGHSNHRFKVQSTLDPSDSAVVSGSEDNRIFFWDLVEANILRSVQDHGGPVFSVSFFEDTMVTASADGLVKVWRVVIAPRGRPEQKRTAHTGGGAWPGSSALETQTTMPATTSAVIADVSASKVRRRGDRGGKRTSIG